MIFGKIKNIFSKSSGQQNSDDLTANSENQSLVDHSDNANVENQVEEGFSIELSDCNESQQEENSQSEEITIDIELTEPHENNDAQQLEDSCSSSTKAEDPEDPYYILMTRGPYDPRRDLADYKFPSYSYLKVYPHEYSNDYINQREVRAKADCIVNTIQNYGFGIDAIRATVSPAMTLFELTLNEGTRVSRIQSLEQTIMLDLGVTGIRIIAPMPGKGTVGIEIPNDTPLPVSVHSVLASKRFCEENRMHLPIALGRTSANEVFLFDLSKLPHLLIAGAVEQGKSSVINTILASLFYKKHPSELKLVLANPRKVEFVPYLSLNRHFLAAMPFQDDEDAIISERSYFINTLNSLIIEMEDRYKLLLDAGVRNIVEYNNSFISRRLNPAKVVSDGIHHHFLPYIVIVVDEYSDYLIHGEREVESLIARITQRAHVVGMHMILTTRQPSVHKYNSTFLSNISARIALRTLSASDSRIVLDTEGAERLEHKGDLLFSFGGSLTRVQSAFVEFKEMDAILQHISEQPHYSGVYELPIYPVPQALSSGNRVNLKHLDPMFADVARYVVSKQEGSTTRLQRAFEIGYHRAGVLSDQLEAAGIVGPEKGPKGRDVLIIDLVQLQHLLDRLGV